MLKGLGVAMVYVGVGDKDDVGAGFIEGSVNGELSLLFLIPLAHCVRKIGVNHYSCSAIFK